MANIPRPDGSTYTSACSAALIAPSWIVTACLYDSGAPYVRRPAGQPPQLVSVESTGPDCPHTQHETTARTDNLVPWIKRVTGLP